MFLNLYLIHPTLLGNLPSQKAVNDARQNRVSGVVIHISHDRLGMPQYAHSCTVLDAQLMVVESFFVNLKRIKFID